MLFTHYIILTLLIFFLVIAVPVMAAYYRCKTKYDIFSIEEMINLEKKIANSKTLSFLFDPETLQPYDRAILERKVTELWFNGHLRDYRQGMEMDYIVRGYLMPYNSVIDSISDFDNSRPKKDIQKFIHTLATKVNLTDEDVIRRIREVRRISRYLTKNRITERTRQITI